MSVESSIAQPGRPGPVDLAAVGPRLSEIMRQRLRRARLRSRLILPVRFILVAMAAASLASVLVYTSAYSAAGGFRAERAAGELDSVTMINPRFTGRIGEDLTYTLTAQRAQRDLEGQAPITLNDPVYTEENGRIVLAPDGAYDPAAGRIDLQGGVTFTDSGGNRFTSRAAVVDLENKVLRGDMEIVGEGPLGVVRADAYELHSLDNKIVFRGRVRGVMPERGRALPTRNETQPRATAAGGGETGG